jgi:gamma-glutamylcyclotransferase (GGCT)/AIG2-like uncharacterized protein YtfP
LSVAAAPATDAPGRSIYMIRHVFVYGTLRPGDVRWAILEPFVVDGGAADTADGSLFDTGLDYPAAVFGTGGTIVGHRLALLETSIGRALDVLDEVEDVVGGEYTRVRIRTGMGIDAWAYAYGSGLTLTLIPSGDWFLHRPPRA